MKVSMAIGIIIGCDLIPCSLINIHISSI